MTNSTRTLFAAAIVAATLSTGLTATPSLAQLGNSTDPWCDDGRDVRSGDERATFCEVRDFTLPAAGATLTVDAAPNGGISVEGSDRGDITVRARVNATARTMEQARALASRIDLVTTAERIEARGPNGLGDRESWSVSYRIEAPRTTPLSLQTTNGGISIKNVQSEIRFRTVNGGVQLSSLAGSVEGSTSNGGIKVDLDGTTWQGQGMDVSTSNGGVTLRIPGDYSAHLEAGTVNGGLNIDFPVTVQGRLGRTISTDLGSGGPTLRVKTNNGGVRIQRK
jgi:hypothetical protein